jgi:hypothetical protein
MERQKLLLSLTGDAVQALSANATERKRGELASKAILAYVQPQKAPVSGVGILERIEARLARLETLLMQGRSVNGV